MSTNRSKDRSSLCSFMFVDGRHCRIPRAAHPYLCAFHGESVPSWGSSLAVAVGFLRRLVRGRVSTGQVRPPCC